MNSPVRCAFSWNVFVSHRVTFSDLRCCNLLVIIGDVDPVGVPSAPNETDSVLVVNPNTVLSLSVASQFLQAVARRRFQVVYRCRTVQYREFAFGNSCRGRAGRLASSPDFLRAPIGETPYHLEMITIAVTNVNRYYSQQEIGRSRSCYIRSTS